MSNLKIPSPVMYIVLCLRHIARLYMALYGSCLTDVHIERLYVAWRKAVRAVKKTSTDTHISTS